MKRSPCLLFVTVFAAGCLQVPAALPEPGAGGDGGTSVDGFGTPDVGSDATPEADGEVTVDMGPPAPEFIGVTAGASHACAWTDEGRVACWGGNISGQIEPDGPNSFAPTWLDTPQRFETVSAGVNRTCGITRSGELSCWGNNANMFLVSTMDREIAPTVIDISETTVNVPTDVEVGLDAVCFRAGSTFCWGINNAGVIQPGEMSSGLIGPINRGSNIDIELGGATACSVNGMGHLQCWGTNHQLRVDPSQANGVLLGERSPLAERVRGVAPGALHTCAILRDSGGVRCWGSEGAYRLGINYEDLDGPFGDVPGLAAMQGIDADVHTCALGDDGTVTCWGPNPLGEEPHTLSAGDGSPFTAISVGSQYACAISASGVWCWGANRSGESGQPAIEDDTSTYTVMQPMLVPLPE